MFGHPQILLIMGCISHELSQNNGENLHVFCLCKGKKSQSSRGLNQESWNDLGLDSEKLQAAIGFWEHWRATLWSHGKEKDWREWQRGLGSVAFSCNRWVAFEPVMYKICCDWGPLHVINIFCWPNMQRKTYCKIGHCWRVQRSRREWSLNVYSSFVVQISFKPTFHRWVCHSLQTIL